MSISVITYPAVITPAKNPVVFEITTEVSSGEGVARVTINYPRDETQGATYQFFWDGGNKVITVECVASPNNSGTQFPVRKTESTLEWLWKVLSFFKFNTLLTADYDLKVDEESSHLVFMAKNPGPAYNMVYNLFNSYAQVFLTDATAGVVKTNLKIGLQVHRQGQGTNAFISEDLVTPKIVNNTASAIFEVGELLIPTVSTAFRISSGYGPDIFYRLETALPFYIKYYEQYGDPAVIDRLITSRWFYSLNGGVPPWKHVEFFKTYDNLTQYFNTTGRFFLTWHWFPKETDLYAPEKLYLVIPRQPNTTGFSIRVTKHFYDDGDEITDFYVAYSFSVGQVYELNVGYASLVGSFIENLIAYDVQLISQNGSFYSDIFSFTIDVRSLPNVRYFMFLNSLGGFECVRFTGESIYELGFERDYFDRATLKEYDENFSPRSQLAPETTRSFKVNTGWISKETVDWMQDFLNSTEVYEIKDSKRFPVLITQDKLELQRDTITLYSLTISMQYADFPDVFQREKVINWEEVSQIEDPYLQD